MSGISVDEMDEGTAIETAVKMKIKDSLDHVLDVVFMTLKNPIEE